MSKRNTTVWPKVGEMGVVGKNEGLGIYLAQKCFAGMSH